MGKRNERWTSGTSADELSLAEFPIGLIASRPASKSALEAEFRCGEKRWVVTGHAKHGLPTEGDRDLYLVLMEAARQQSYPAKVCFERRQILSRLGWQAASQGYERLELGLSRLVGATIRAENAFYDPSKQCYYPVVAFHILDAYGTETVSCGRRGADCWFRWGPEFYQNLVAGRWKGLDLDLYFSLRSPVSRALYRFLDLRRLDGKRTLSLSLKRLAFEHLGLSRTYYPSQIKRSLSLPHEELRTVGLVAEVRYEEDAGEARVHYQFGETVTTLDKREEKQAVKAAVADLKQRLDQDADLARGVRLMEEAQARRSGPAHPRRGTT